MTHFDTTLERRQALRDRLITGNIIDGIDTTLSELVSCIHKLIEMGASTKEITEALQDVNSKQFGNAQKRCTYTEI